MKLGSHGFHTEIANSLNFYVVKSDNESNSHVVCKRQNFGDGPTPDFGLVIFPNFS